MPLKSAAVLTLSWCLPATAIDCPLMFSILASRIYRGWTTTLRRVLPTRRWYQTGLPIRSRTHCRRAHVAYRRCWQRGQTSAGAYQAWCGMLNASPLRDRDLRKTWSQYYYALYRSRRTVKAELWWLTYDGTIGFFGIGFFLGYSRHVLFPYL